MLTPQQELEIVQRIAYSEPAGRYEAHDDCYKLYVDGNSSNSGNSSNTVKITIIDDSIISISHIDVEVNNIDTIDLTVIIESGRYHNNDLFNDVTPYNLSDELEHDTSSVAVYCTNKINKLTVIQQVMTEHIYSYYGNQDGFNAAEVHIKCNMNAIDTINLRGNISMISERPPNDNAMCSLELYI